MGMSRNPDLQRLLASLNGTDIQTSAGVQPQQNTQNYVQLSHESFSQNHNHSSTRTEYNPRHISGLSFAQIDSPGKSKATIEKAVDPRKRPSTNNSTLPIPSSDGLRSLSVTPVPQEIPDASEITTWPAALKHVTKYIVPNDKISSRIKHLISEQHKHERQWWAQREAIIARHQGRLGNQAKAAELLRSLGCVSTPTAKVDPESDQAEIDAFDRKVYKSLTQLVADYDGQLRKMGIPFYAIKHDLVILESGQENQGVAKGRLDRGELGELQKRMLETLEDLFGEDEVAG